jgi:UDP-N-acetylglucosamine:LPS N-acetylglucosamine transferase
MVPVIRHFRNDGCEVILAGSGRSGQFLKSEFPDLQFVELQGATISYTSGNYLFFKLLASVPSFLWHTIAEYYKVRKLCKKFEIDVIVSDNRYGCRQKNLPSAIIIHQLNIRLTGQWRVFEKLAQLINCRLIHRFDECWIPDFEARNGIAGALSHPATLPENAHYIGILSRFTSMITLETDAIPPSIDLLFLLSGPEPQRTIFEKAIFRNLSGLEVTSVIVQGIPGSTDAVPINKNTHLFPHLESSQLLELMARASLVICRSGYSTIMDLITVGKRAVLVPTPGQPEQEYLARYLSDKKVYLSMKQENFDILYAMELSKIFPGMVIRNDETDLEERVAGLIRKIKPSGTSQSR